MAVQVILGLGSNMGDSKAILASAVRDISTVLDAVKVSSLYITKPQDYLEQDDFCNMVCVGMYEGSPQALLAATQKIEYAHGRDRTKAIPKGPRLLDIDILHFGDEIIDEANLQVPHPAMKKRAFVLIPLLELLPKSADLISKESYVDIFGRLEDQGVKKADS